MNSNAEVRRIDRKESKDRKREEKKEMMKNKDGETVNDVLQGEGNGMINKEQAMGYL